MASFRPRSAKRFRVSTRVIRGKGTRIGVVIPGLKRATRRTVQTPNLAKPE